MIFKLITVSQIHVRMEENVISILMKMDLNAFAWANTEAKLANKDLLVSTWTKKSKDGEKII